MRTSVLLIGVLTAVAPSAMAQPAASTPRTASANPRDPLRLPAEGTKAHEHYLAGRQAFNEQRWDDAIIAWGRGAVADDLPVFFFNLGQAHRQAGNYAKARWCYQRFVEKVGDAPEAREAVARARELIRLMTDAADRPPTAAEPPVTKPVERSDDDDKPAESNAPNVAPVVLTAPPTSDAREQERWYHDTVGWSLAASAIALVGTGTGLAIYGRQLAKDADDAITQREQQRLNDRSSTYSTWGVLTLGTGGVLATLATVRLILTPSSPVRAASTVSLDAGLGWASLRIAF